MSPGDLLYKKTIYFSGARECQNRMGHLVVCRLLYSSHLPVMKNGRKCKCDTLLGAFKWDYPFGAECCFLCFPSGFSQVNLHTFHLNKFHVCVHVTHVFSPRPNLTKEYSTNHYNRSRCQNRVFTAKRLTCIPCQLWKQNTPTRTTQQI